MSQGRGRVKSPGRTRNCGGIGHARKGHTRLEGVEIGRRGPRGGRGGAERACGPHAATHIHSPPLRIPRARDPGRTMSEGRQHTWGRNTRRGTTGLGAQGAGGGARGGRECSPAREAVSASSPTASQRRGGRRRGGVQAQEHIRLHISREGGGARTSRTRAVAGHKVAAEFCLPEELELVSPSHLALPTTLSAASLTGSIVPVQR